MPSDTPLVLAIIASYALFLACGTRLARWMIARRLARRTTRPARRDVTDIRLARRVRRYKKRRAPGDPTPFLRKGTK